MQDYLKIYCNRVFAMFESNYIRVNKKARPSIHKEMEQNKEIISLNMRYRLVYCL